MNAQASSRRHYAALGAGLTAASIWGAMYVVSKAVMAVVPPLTLLSARLVLGALALAPFLRWGNRPPGRAWPRILAVGAVGYGLSLSLQFVGTHWSTAANGALVTTATPAFVFLFARALLRERIPPRRWAALALATAGVLVVVDPRQARLDPTLFWGNVLLALAALTWALYSVLVGQLAREHDLLWVSVGAFVGGLLLALPASAYELTTAGLGGPLTGRVVAGVLFVGLGSTALAMALWNYAFARLPAGVAGLTFFAQPLVGTLLSAWFLHEPLTPAFWLGAALIVLGVLWATQEGA
ncbi:MAG: EamA family transporter [Chloroflexi bacterium]|nr:EamA family transporter [Chloroflexota bacterium]